MARYFLDTAVVTGLTFFHDAWHDEAERLFATENSLFVNRAVVYEYCNSKRNNDLETAEVDWESENGKFGQLLKPVRAAQWNIDMRIDGMSDDELDSETLVEIFLEETERKDETDGALLDEYIRPRLRQFVKDTVGDRDVTTAVGKDVIDELIDTLETKARDKRKEIRIRVSEMNVSESDREPFEGRVESLGGYVDSVILGSVGYLHDNGFLHKFVSSDGHFYKNREFIENTVGVTILHIKDDFATPKIP